ncbi:MAG: universal stress protein [Myxococcota bacterium]|nr:universal stress protein [Myxococcota bacterium]
MRLVVGVDFRVGSLRALRHSMRMLQSGIAREVHVLHVLEGDRADDPVLRECVPDALAELTLQLGGTALELARPSGAWAHVRSGVVEYELRRLAFDVSADVIAIGTRTRDSGDEGRAEPLGPFSVLTVGAEMVLDSRPFRCERCDVCDRIRAAPDAIVPWCPAHARAGARALRIVPPGTVRVLH